MKKEPEQKKEISKVAEKEMEILRFWRERDIFQKSLEKNKEGEPFVFYDGPPFATGLPHYGHLLAGTIKDVIPRYQTMKGKYVRRQWGWDCHGLPIENLIEEELGLKNKKDIEALGVEKFNEAAKASVLRYDTDWKEIVPRMGRWVDMEKSYRTMDWQYTESIWWAFKRLYDKGLIYEGFKSMHICPRCETTLAISEVTQGYKDITDISVYVKFELDDEPGTFMLAWTTTPWTLPGNVALAVNSEIVYSLIAVGKERFVLAKSRLETVKEKYEVIREFKGGDLIDKTYKPIFDYYSKDEKLPNRENGWKVYGADFVNTESGTGIVHIAPAFGEDDMELGKKYDLPFIQHVGMDGRFKPEVMDFAGALVKPKENPQEADIMIIKNLAHRGLLFAKEKITHPYPHCWRCDTPLLNYAASSWFVGVTKFKEKLIEANKKIRFVPEHIRDGRFGKWLEGARDWAISRSRYWGAPIPVWKCEKCATIHVVGSLADITKAKKPRNEYILIRHGEAEHNKENVLSGNPDTPHHLTKKGIQEVRETAEKLKGLSAQAGKKIDFIFTSPFVRTKETADILAETLGVSGVRIIVDNRLRELVTGDLDGKSVSVYHSYFSSPEEKFYKPTPHGETLLDMKRRVMDFLSDIDASYEGKTVLVVTHEYPSWMLAAGARGADIKEAVAMKEKVGEDFIETGGSIALSFVPFPHNHNYELDLHRPYIDEIVFECSDAQRGRNFDRERRSECGGMMRRVPEVFDCWFESGSMPYAQFHYLGNDATAEGKLFRANFPADFIAEGLDQTRGWFYNMLVLSIGLFGESAYRNVIVNGLILAEDGQKMSKRLKNYPDPAHIIDTYGADALRYYLLASPVVRGETLFFSEKGVDEVYKKIILRLENVLSFYELYQDGVSQMPKGESPHVLDRWILSRVSELGKQIEEALDAYELDRAVKPIGDFVDDLSTWYIRRSRDRFKEEGEDKEFARKTTREALLSFSKIIAPILPFIAEDIYRRLGGVKESVHLEAWPVFESQISNLKSQILPNMREIRRIVSLALDERMKAKIKVRQPIASLNLKSQISNLKNNDELLQLVKDEVNVKEIIFSALGGEDSLENDVWLDTRITPELKQEGQAREFMRTIQDIRKKIGLSPSDVVALTIATDESGRAVIDAFAKEIQKTVRAESIVFAKEISGESFLIDDISFTVVVKKR
ncbi:MAG: class I tRNA ligase family protein [Candidatus Lloydbacteria bacterium]|nr:class I tRNA ligase family protein [Candidatus Lloydbacteria bacterium]